MSDAPAAAAPAEQAKDTSCEYVEKFATLQEQLYASETSNEWVDANYQGIVDMLSDDKAPKAILLRSHELAAKYAPKFPALSKDAFSAAMQQVEQGDVTVVHAVMKKIDGYLSVPGVVLEKAPEYLLSLYEKRGAADAEQACKSVETILNKMAATSPAILAKTCVELLLAEGATTEAWRDFILKYLTTNVLEEQKAALAASPESEIEVKDAISKLLHVVSKKEFSVLLNGLTTLAISQPKGQFGPQGIVATLASLIDLEADVDFTVLWQIERSLSIITTAVTHFSEGIVDNAFTKYLVTKCVAPEGVFEQATPAHSVAVLQKLCEVAPYCSEEAAAECVKALYPILLKSLPESEESTDINFTFLECLMIAISSLGRKAPDAFAEVSNVKVGADVKAAQAAAASEIKSKECLDAERDLKAKMTNLQSAISRIMLQLNNAKTQLQKAPEKTAASKAKIAEIFSVLPNLQAVVLLAKPFSDTYPHFPPASFRPSWVKPKRNHNNNNKKQQKRGRGEDSQPAGNAQKKQRTESGKKGGKGGKGRKGGKGGRKGGKK
eukprot:TRINITY_DN977_c0_g2_i1.p1 TRINITY_DN977_c0_g2~~TRINITY_DN977_c0_g2_i1.p1  ORF type:complete len:566 (+),score=146.93 TRINITY_DN977_c0_g2_i1:44-1699(+)